MMSEEEPHPGKIGFVSSRSIAGGALASFFFEAQGR
jgi:hypothetical protein